MSTTSKKKLNLAKFWCFHRTFGNCTSFRTCWKSIWSTQHYKRSNLTQAQKNPIRFFIWWLTFNQYRTEFREEKKFCSVKCSDFRMSTHARTMNRVEKFISRIYMYSVLAWTRLSNNWMMIGIINLIFCWIFLFFFHANWNSFYQIKWMMNLSWEL